VRLHDGEVDIASRLGKGTRVTVRLPLDCEGRAADPVKLVSERAHELAVTANPDIHAQACDQGPGQDDEQVKKSA